VIFKDAGSMPKRTRLTNKSLENFCEKFGFGAASRVPILGIAKNSKAPPSLGVSVDAFMANLRRDCPILQAWSS
jgi:hypothetical protein